MPTIFPNIFIHGFEFRPPRIGWRAPKLTTRVTHPIRLGRISLYPSSHMQEAKYASCDSGQGICTFQNWERARILFPTKMTELKHRNGNPSANGSAVTPERVSLAEWIRRRARFQLRTNGQLKPDLHVSSDDAVEGNLEHVSQLLDFAKKQTAELIAERRKRQRAEQALVEIRDRLKESERSRKNAKSTLRRASRELNSLRYGNELPTLADLRRQIDEIHEHYVNALAEAQTGRTLTEANLKMLTNKLEELQFEAQKKRAPVPTASISERVNEELTRRRKAEKESRNLKRNLRHTSRALKNLRRDHSKCRSNSYPVRYNGTASRYAVFDLLLPNLSLARNSQERLSKARDAKQVFSDLMRINDAPGAMRGERVGSAEPWFEIRPTLSDRIYYRQTNGNGRYLVLIGDKNSQAADISWMRQNRR